MSVTIDEYIASCDPKMQPHLNAIRATIKENAPDATERMSWQMPTFYLKGNLVHFAAASRHIGFYPGASGVEHFLPKLEGYKTSKGTVQFPIDKPIPHELIAEIVRFRVSENLGES